MKAKLTLLPGDGIGPEIVDATRQVLETVARKSGHTFTFSTHLIGGIAIDETGVPLPDDTIVGCRSADAVLLGAVGGPKWDDPNAEVRPEQGLLGMRKALQLFANVRPVKLFRGLEAASPLRAERLRGVDLVFIRELTGGIYFGEPKGISKLKNGERRGINTQVYDTHEIIRVARVAFELAEKRNGKVTSSEKSNVMESGLLWREEVTKLHSQDYSHIELEHMLADACAMQLVRQPKQFDVIVTDNLFGDMLSDEAAMLTGSLGMLPSASLGARDESGKQCALYEPVHGSAPDIAGLGVANPIATIMSFAMALRYSFDLGAEADLIEGAVEHVLEGGLRTADIMQEKKARVSTGVMGDAIIREMRELVS